jgi:cytoskeletal protein RodZ
MELTYVTIMVLASMVFVLSAMVGYLYWQQTRMLQHVQSLALALAAHVEYTRQQEVVQQEPVQESEEEEEDDRVSVKEQVEVVEGPPTASATPVLPATPPAAPITATEPSTDDVDDLQDKTSAELRELLTKKGIPYGKRDSKTVLLQLLKATS